MYVEPGSAVDRFVAVRDGGSTTGLAPLVIVGLVAAGTAAAFGTGAAVGGTAARKNAPPPGPSIQNIKEQYVYEPIVKEGGGDELDLIPGIDDTAVFIGGGLVLLAVVLAIKS